VLEGQGPLTEFLIVRVGVQKITVDLERLLEESLVDVELRNGCRLQGIGNRFSRGLGIRVKQLFFTDEICRSGEFLPRDLVVEDFIA